MRLKHDEGDPRITACTCVLTPPTDGLASVASEARSKCCNLIGAYSKAAVKRIRAVPWATLNVVLPGIM